MAHNLRLRSGEPLQHTLAGFLQLGDILDLISFELLMFLLHHGENFAAQFDVGLQGIGQRHEFLMGGIRAASGMRVRGEAHYSVGSGKVRLSRD